MFKQIEQVMCCNPMPASTILRPVAPVNGISGRGARGLLGRERVLGGGDGWPVVVSSRLSPKSMQH